MLYNGDRLRKQAEDNALRCDERDARPRTFQVCSRTTWQVWASSDPDADAKTAGLIWMHALAIGYSPAYLTENADGIRRDWPRIPLPADRKALEASAALGEQIAALLDTEADVPGVTCGKIAPCSRPSA